MTTSNQQIKTGQVWKRKGSDTRANICGLNNKKKIVMYITNVFLYVQYCSFDEFAEYFELEEGWGEEPQQEESDSPRCEMCNSPDVQKYTTVGDTKDTINILCRECAEKKFTVETKEEKNERLRAESRKNVGKMPNWNDRYWHVSDGHVLDSFFLSGVDITRYHAGLTRNTEEEALELFNDKETMAAYFGEGVR
ncbi:MAG: hypothetical protein WCP97_00605 [bacterium]